MTAQKQPSYDLYTKSGSPCANFNKFIVGWLDEALQVSSHKTPIAFEPLRIAYNKMLQVALDSSTDPTLPEWQAHRTLLSTLTNMMLETDITSILRERLSSENINIGGTRTALGQSLLKNTGENFINIIVYVIARLLAHQDEVLVDKGLPPPLRPLLTMQRTFEGSESGEDKLNITIETDLSIFSRSNPGNAIIISAKTRLKEVFHIGTMWKLFFDMLEDEYCQRKWNLKVGTSEQDLWGMLAEPPKPEILYVFVTGDMISDKGTNTQGPDVIRPEPRNLIKMDASFFDYVFVSHTKDQYDHISDSLDLQRGRETLFHEPGCLLDLIEQKFAPLGFSYQSAPATSALKQRHT